eukprot:scaffold3504_cov240-Pinguiococcus_pyrenoidosus.AAC.51
MAPRMTMAMIMPANALMVRLTLQPTGGTALVHQIANAALPRDGRLETEPQHHLHDIQREDQDRQESLQVADEAAAASGVPVVAVFDLQPAGDEDLEVEQEGKHKRQGLPLLLELEQIGREAVLGDLGLHVDVVVNVVGELQECANAVVVLPVQGQLDLLLGLVHRLGGFPARLGEGLTRLVRRRHLRDAGDADAVAVDLFLAIAVGGVLVSRRFLHRAGIQRTVCAAPEHLDPAQVIGDVHEGAPVQVLLFLQLARRVAIPVQHLGSPRRLRLQRREERRVRLGQRVHERHHLVGLGEQVALFGRIQFTGLPAQLELGEAQHDAVADRLGVQPLRQRRRVLVVAALFIGVVDVVVVEALTGEVRRDGAALDDGGELGHRAGGQDLLVLVVGTLDALGEEIDERREVPHLRLLNGTQGMFVVRALAEELHGGVEHVVLAEQPLRLGVMPLDEQLKEPKEPIESQAASHVEQPSAVLEDLLAAVALGRIAVDLLVPGSRRARTLEDVLAAALEERVGSAALVVEGRRAQVVHHHVNARIFHGQRLCDVRVVGALEVLPRAHQVRVEPLLHVLVSALEQRDAWET